MVVEYFESMTRHLIFMFFPELIFLIFVQRTGGRFKIRTSSIVGHKNLKPFANTWMVGLIVLAIYIGTVSLQDSELLKPFDDWINSFDWYILPLTGSLFLFNLVVLVNYTMKKHKDKLTLIAGLGAGVLLVIFLLINGYFDIFTQ